ncbi:MAG: 2-(1,2-epoxy,2-dihydrophenyl)acetyl-CoA isomerase [Bacteroidota bacterium]
MIKAIRNLPIPVLAYVNGPAAGAGCSLALACDYIIADENAYFAELFALIGLAVDAGSTAFLIQTLGYQKAFEIVSSARKIPASEAMQIGWVSKIVNSENSAEILQNEIDRFIQMPTKVIGLMKLALQKAHNLSLDEILELEADNQTIAGQSHDFAEGVMAFLQKRPAKFMGK